MPVAEPIVALATAPGRGAIGIIRVSGPALGGLRAAILNRELPARRAVHTPFFGADGQPIDQGLAIFFPAPDSYTGEDVLELQAHGGPVVLQMLLERLLALGAAQGLRPARAGEFTERAFLNGKIDLCEAEAVADLIDAQSSQAARLAVRSLRGEFSRRIHALLEPLIHLRMLVEATLDFPDEEVDALDRDDLTGQWHQVREQLDQVLAQASVGARLREGITVVIAGEPNVGKSSLLNRLAGEEVAIVTPIAGTTRDRIRESVVLDGVPVNLIDTAGLRQTDDLVERIGVEVTRREISRADLVLLIEAARLGGSDGTTASTDDDHSDSSLVVRAEAMVLAEQAGIPVLRVINKIDLNPGAKPGIDESGVIHLSALTGAGLADLQTRLLQTAGWQPGAEAQFMARERHLQSLRRAVGHMDKALEVLPEGLELFAEELRLAQQAIGEVTGQFSADDLLGEIFRSFCIGK